MQHLKTELAKLKAREQELQFLLQLNKQSQDAISEALKVTSHNGPETVSKRLGTPTLRVHEGRVTVGMILQQALVELGEPQDTISLTQYVIERRPGINTSTVNAALKAGVTSGTFTCLKNYVSDKRILYWKLNEAKKVEIQKKYATHTRPNQGIGQRVIEEINEIVKKDKSRYFSAYYLYSTLKDDYPDADERTVESVLSRLVVDQTPGLKKKTWKGDTSYLASQYIRLK